MSIITIDTFEESRERFKEWKQNTSPVERKKMLITGLKGLDRYVYLKEEDIQDYDMQDRMMILYKDLDNSQLQEIYPDINDLWSYMTGGLFLKKRGGLSCYFRNTFREEQLYDWSTFREIMMDPITIASHQQGASKKAIEYHMKCLSEEFNKGIISVEFYENEIRELLDRYFPCLTIDSDAQLHAKEEYLLQIQTAYKNNTMTEKEFVIQEKWVQLSIVLHDE